MRLYLPIYLPIYLSTYQSTYLPTYLCIYLSIIHMYINPSYWQTCCRSISSHIIHAYGCLSMPWKVRSWQQMIRTPALWWTSSTVSWWWICGNWWVRGASTSPRKWELEAFLIPWEPVFDDHPTSIRRVCAKPKNYPLFTPTFTWLLRWTKSCTSFFNGGRHHFKGFNIFQASLWWCRHPSRISSLAPVLPAGVPSATAPESLSESESDGRSIGRVHKSQVWPISLGSTEIGGILMGSDMDGM